MGVEQKGVLDTIRYTGGIKEGETPELLLKGRQKSSEVCFSSFPFKVLSSTVTYLQIDVPFKLPEHKKPELLQCCLICVPFAII